MAWIDAHLLQAGRACGRRWRGAPRGGPCAGHPGPRSRRRSRGGRRRQQRLDHRPSRRGDAVAVRLAAARGSRPSIRRTAVHRRRTVVVSAPVLRSSPGGAPREAGTTRCDASGPGWPSTSASTPGSSASSAWRSRWCSAWAHQARLRHRPGLVPEQGRAGLQGQRRLPGPVRRPGHAQPVHDGGRADGRRPLHAREHRAHAAGRGASCATPRACSPSSARSPPSSSRRTW